MAGVGGPAWAGAPRRTGKAHRARGRSARAAAQPLHGSTLALRPAGVVKEAGGSPATAATGAQQTPLQARCGPAAPRGGPLCSKARRKRQRPPSGPPRGAQGTDSGLVGGICEKSLGGGAAQAARIPLEPGSARRRDQAGGWGAPRAALCFKAARGAGPRRQAWRPSQAVPGRARAVLLLDIRTEFRQHAANAWSYLITAA